MSVALKNVVSGSFDELQISSDFLLLKASNEGPYPTRLERDTDQRFIQFHFNLKGHVQYVFHNGHYVLDLPEDQSLLLYNPETELSLHAVLTLWSHHQLTRELSSPSVASLWRRRPFRPSWV